jgi:adenylate cyclase
VLGPLSAAARAVAGRLDRNPALAAVLRTLRTRLGGADIDPLRLPPALAGQLATHLAAVAGTRPSVLGELGLSAVALWQAHAGTSHDTDADELTVVFTDLSGFSQWTLRVGDQTAVWALRRVAVAIEPLLAAEGTLVKRLGDGLMIVYTSPDEAVRGVLAARRAVAELDPAGHRLALRAGIHTGRPTPLGGDFYGRDVNIAARLTDTAGPGEIALSPSTVHRLDRRPERYGPLARRRVVRTDGVPAHLTAHILEPEPGDAPVSPWRRCS